MFNDQAEKIKVRDEIEKLKKEKSELEDRVGKL